MSPTKELHKFVSEFCKTCKFMDEVFLSNRGFVGYQDGVAIHHYRDNDYQFFGNAYKLSLKDEEDNRLGSVIDKLRPKVLGYKQLVNNDLVFTEENGNGINSFTMSKINGDSVKVILQEFVSESYAHYFISDNNTIIDNNNLPFTNSNIQLTIKDHRDEVDSNLVLLQFDIEKNRVKVLPSKNQLEKGKPFVILENNLLPSLATLAKKKEEFLSFAFNDTFSRVMVHYGVRGDFITKLTFRGIFNI